MLRNKISSGAGRGSKGLNRDREIEPAYLQVIGPFDVMRGPGYFLCSKRTT